MDVCCDLCFQVYLGEGLPIAEVMAVTKRDTGMVPALAGSFKAPVLPAWSTSTRTLGFCGYVWSHEWLSYGGETTHSTANTFTDVYLNCCIDRSSPATASA